MKPSSVSSRFVRRSASVAALAAAGFLPLFSGCTTTTPGPGGVGVVAYGHGELSTDVTHELDAVFGAAQRALSQLEIVKIDDKRTRVDAQILSRTATDKKIVVNLYRVTDSLTKVEIKVGLVGDETLSRLILDRMFAELR
jgi:hypothetical protein